MKNLIKTIQNTAFREGLWKKGSRVVLGVSGGPDSVCMLDALAKIAPKHDLELIIGHVNYGLRGKDSNEDEKFVKELAKKYDLKIEVLNPKNIKATENSLRNIRYDFFEKVRIENNFDSIAVAHNADDQVETFLMRVIRGAGLQGLSAMKYRSGFIIRPLLNISRKEILEYLKNRGLKYRTDKTNRENLYSRNKIRNGLLPYLEKNFNPKIRQTIFDATVSIAEDYSFLAEYAEELTRDQESLSVKRLLELHPALQRRTLLHYIRGQKNNLEDIEAAHIEEALKALRSTKGKNQVVVFKGLKLTRKGDKVIISCL
ncbi:MAG: tRNA lysidine(34) synthetase TilS [Parcubacteria group bacterium]|jgi:tRNA(Ile)-lysidine synthase